MISLNKNTANNVPVTLFEFTTIYDPRYLFSFQNKQTNVYSYCLVGEDLSVNKERYNEFVITDQSTPDPSLSQVDLTVGEYYYTAYQLTEDQAAALDFNAIDTAGFPVVEGPCKMRVREESDTNTFYSTETTNTVYEN